MMHSDQTLLTDASRLAHHHRGGVGSVKSSSSGRANARTPMRGRTRTLSKADILLGRGKGCTSSEGNQRYLNLVEQFAPVYVQAGTRKEQSRIKLDIIDAVHDYGGRFMQPCKDSKREFEEAPLQVIMDKIGQVRGECLARRGS